MVKWYHKGLQNPCRGFDSYRPCQKGRLVRMTRRLFSSRGFPYDARDMRKNLNLMIVGASGGVAQAFLHHLTAYRRLFGKLVLVDAENRVDVSPFLDHELLDYVFIKRRIDLKRDRKGFVSLIRRKRADVVVDLTDQDSIPFLEAVDEAGASCVSTGINADARSIPETTDEVFRRRKELARAPHVVCSGMNPGCVNVWVRHGMLKHGMPRDITHFEYDTSQMRERWRPMVTWSVKEFLEEAMVDDAGVTLGRFRVRKLPSNSFMHRKSLKPILKPIMPLKEYPEGFLMFHEECTSIADRYDLPSKFIYAIHPKTAKRIVEIYRRKGTVTEKDLIVGDNRHDVLEGSDTIGVVLDYPDKKVYYVNSFPNGPVIGTNATYTQVIVGIYAALFTLRRERLSNGVHFPEDLARTYYRQFVFDNMRVQEFVFRKDGRDLKLKSRDPRVTIPSRAKDRRFIL